MSAIASAAGLGDRVSTARREPWRIPWYIWCLIGVALLAVTHFRHPSLLHGDKVLLVVTGDILLVLIAAILWELPPAVMVCGAIALTVFSGNWTTFGLPGFPFVPDRILLVGAVLAVLLCSPGAVHVPAPKIKGVHLLMLLTVLYATASAALDGQLAHQTGVFGILDELGAIPFLMFLLAPVIFSTPRERNWLLATLVFLGAYLGLTAIFETLGPHGLVFPRYIASYDAAHGGHQATGPFSEVVADGFACYGCSVAAAAAAVKWSGKWRWLAAAVSLVALFGAALTLERGVWIGAAAGSLVVALVVRELRTRLLPAVIAAIAVVAAVVLLTPSLHGAAATRASDQLSVWDRENQTAAALNMIQTKPLFGFGWANWANTAVPYFRLAPGRPLTGYPSSINSIGLGYDGYVVPNAQISRGGLTGEVHDTYLSNAVALGLVGASLWLVAVLWGLAGAVLRRGSPELRPWRLGLLALSLCYLVICAVDPLSTNFVQLLLWTWAGVAVADSFGDGTMPTRRQPTAVAGPG